jgi:hypothetical protein
MMNLPLTLLPFDEFLDSIAPELAAVGGAQFANPQRPPQDSLRYPKFERRSQPHKNMLLLCHNAPQSVNEKARKTSQKGLTVVTHCGTNGL